MITNGPAVVSSVTPAPSPGYKEGREGWQRGYGLSHRLLITVPLASSLFLDFPGLDYGGAPRRPGGPVFLSTSLLGPVSSSLPGGPHLPFLPPGAGGEGQANGSPVPVALAGLVLPLAPGPGWEKRGQKGAADDGQWRERDRGKKGSRLTSAPDRPRWVGPYERWACHKRTCKHLDRNILQGKERESATEAGFSGPCGQSGLATLGRTRPTGALTASQNAPCQALPRVTTAAWGSALPQGWLATVRGLRGCLSLSAKGDGAGRGLAASPCQAHFIDRETERPSRQIRSPGRAGPTGWALSGRLVQPQPRNGPPVMGGAPWHAAAERCQQPFPPSPTKAGGAGNRGPRRGTLPRGDDDVG